MRVARLTVVLAAVLLQALACVPSQAAEEIEALDVLVLVRPDGKLDVTETIRVTAEGRQIKRGIFRDFPLYRDDIGAPVTFDVVSVHRNGRSEPYSVTREGGDARLRIGRAEVFLPAPSEQLYEIRYETEGQLRSFDGYDELYWNVTGDRWDFPINSASVEIRLPGETKIMQFAAYTGPYGAQGKAFEAMGVAPGLFRAATTAVLPPGEGFTVAIGWPPGVVAVTRPGTLWGQPVERFSAVGATLIGALVLFAFWLVVGRDPTGKAIYPRFQPPKGVGPAAARYITRQGFDNRCLSAAIISMAVKGSLRIVDRTAGGIFQSHDFSLEPLGSKKKGLTVGELAAYEALFPGGKALDLESDDSNGLRVDNARSRLRSALWEEHYGATFKRNSLFSGIGVLLGLVVAGVFFWMARPYGVDAAWSWLIGGVLFAAFAYAASFVWLNHRELRIGSMLFWKRILRRVWPVAVIALILFVNLLDGFAALPSWPSEGFDPVVFVAGACYGICAVLFHVLMAAPTKAGRRLLDDIEGFELYLRTAEEDRLNVLNPPDRTPQLFERMLPYAVSLGLVHEWSAKFAGVLSNARAPGWYRGGVRFDSYSFDSRLSHAVAATSQPSSSGSGGGSSFGGGSSGGGFSGGGGGGGGGGGW